LTLEVVEKSAAFVHQADNLAENLVELVKLRPVAADTQLVPAVTARQLEMMRHAMGQRFQRNHYVTAKGTEEDSLWSLLVLAGHAVLFVDNTTTRTFHLRPAVVAALKAELVKQREVPNG
jgi:hypothetical protein